METAETNIAGTLDGLVFAFLFWILVKCTVVSENTNIRNKAKEGTTETQMKLPHFRDSEVNWQTVIQIQ